MFVLKIFNEDNQIELYITVVLLNWILFNKFVYKVSL